MADHHMQGYRGHRPPYAAIPSPSLAAFAPEATAKAIADSSFRSAYRQRNSDVVDNPYFEHHAPSQLGGADTAVNTAVQRAFEVHGDRPTVEATIKIDNDGIQTDLNVKGQSVRKLSHTTQNFFK